jgi:hypothetical protein
LPNSEGEPNTFQSYREGELHVNTSMKEDSVVIVNTWLDLKSKEMVIREGPGVS